MAKLRVKDLMSHALEVVSPNAHLRDAWIKMNRTGYRHLPVVANDMLVGIITERDLRLAVNSPVAEETTFANSVGRPVAPSTATMIPTVATAIRRRPKL